VTARARRIRGLTRPRSVTMNLWGMTANDQTACGFLLDSNVVVAVEPFAGEVEPDSSAGAQLIRLANEQVHLLCVAA
jgi:hypothetical protein